MRVLGIDTSSLLGGVAILENETLLAESRLNVAVAHSERLMGEMDRMLRHSDLTVKDIDVFAVAVGPGSFTGLRVGLSTVKGLVYATGRPMVAVPTLEALAWNVPFCRYQVCPLLDARKGEVYAGLFKWTKGGFERIMEERALRIGDLLVEIKEETLFLGEGALLCGTQITGALGSRAYYAPGIRMVPSASNVAFLGMARALNEEFADPASTTPLYLRRSEAEKTGEAGLR